MTDPAIDADLPSDRDEPLARISTAGAMATVVISSFGWNVLHAPENRVVPLTLLGVAFLVTSTLGWIWCERRGRRSTIGWLAALTMLAVPSLWVSELSVFVIVMPLIWLTVTYTSMRWGIALTVMFAALAVLVKARQCAPAVEIYASSTGFLAPAVFAIVVGQLVARERRTRRQLRRYAAEVEELAVTRERNRIARDIHDSVGHYLTVVHVQIEAARATIASDPAGADECLARAEGLSRQGLSELRRSVTILRAGPVEQRPFSVALAGLVEDCRSDGLHTVLTVRGAPRSLLPALEFTLYRAAQEALTNVARHARARLARCTLQYGDREVSLQVADDGDGATSVEGGYGIVGLRERVQLVGGTLEVRTAAGQGFELEVRVPT